MSQDRRKSAIHCCELLFDVLGLIAAWYLTIEVRLLLNPYMGMHFNRAELMALAPPLASVLILWFAAKLWFGFTRPRGSPKLADSLMSVIDSAILASVLTTVVAFFSRRFGAAMSRSFVLLFLPANLCCMLMARYTALVIMAYLHDHWLSPERVAVLGEGKDAHRLIERVSTGGPPYITIAGLILPENSSTDGVQAPIPVLGTTRKLAELINHTRLDRIIVAKGSVPEPEAARCSAISRRLGVVVSHAIAVPDFQVRVRFAELAGLSLVELHPVEFTRAQEVAKRIFDVAIAGAMLLLFAPLLALIAAAVKLSSPGSVLFRAPRVGKGGRYFTFLKFRSMYHEPEGRLRLAGSNEKSGHIFKMKNDPRVTPLGRLLRKYSLDELPQLWNVIRGEMSLVGPRPLPAEDLDPSGQSQEFAFWSEQRSRALPGITGLWQVKGRSDVSFGQMIGLDVDYIRSRSLSLDLRILLATPLVVLTGRGAY